VDSIVKVMMRDGLMTERRLKEEKEEENNNKKAWEEK
jgi:hypothetical protein